MKKLNKVELSWFVRWSSDENKYKRYIELYDEIERLNKIIEIKTNRIQNLMSRLSKRAEKVERLNNIINEIDFYIYEKMRTIYIRANGDIGKYSFKALEEVWHKVSELKGSDKE